MLKKYDIYIASPLFSEEDNKELDIIEKTLEELNLSYFSPRVGCKEEGKELIYLNNKIKNTEFIDDSELRVTLKARDEIASKIYNKNIYSISNSSLLLANTRDFDAGTMYEMGYASGLKIPTMSFTFKKYGLNVMLSQSVIHHIDTIDYDNQDELKDYLQKFINIRDNELSRFSDNFIAHNYCGSICNYYRQKMMTLKANELF